MKSPLKLLRVSIFAVFSIVIGYGVAQARGTYYDAWNNIYPASQSDDNVINGTGKSCQFCHEASSGGDGWNAYGWKVRMGLNAGLTINNAIAAAEGDNSDFDPTASSNLTEITSNTQPGWTSGPNNTIYYKSGSTGTGQSPPSGILGNMDPLAGPICTDADGDTYAIEGGNCGLADCNDADSAINPGATEICTDGKDNDCDGKIDSADPDCAVAVLDLDIASFTATGRVHVGGTVTVKLGVTNNGTVSGSATATIVGVQNSAEVFRTTLTVSDPIGGKASSYTVTYIPTGTGTISWSATVADEDPDMDSATASTKVIQ